MYVTRIGEHLLKKEYKEDENAANNSQVGRSLNADLKQTVIFNY